jgi:hypothetical protein
MTGIGMGTPSLKMKLAVLACEWQGGRSSLLIRKTLTSHSNFSHGYEVTLNDPLVFRGAGD